MTAAAVAPDQQKPSFLSRVGTIAGSLVKHVPTRAILWAVIAFVLGWVCLGLSFVVNVFLFDKAAMLSVYIFALVVPLPFFGGALFAVHGMHRGAARAGLELEQKFGLVRYVVDRVLGLLVRRIGGVVSNLPLAQAESAIKGALNEYVVSDDMREGSGIVGWVLRRVKRRVVAATETYLLSAYRAEVRPDGGGGGVSLQRVSERAGAEVSARLGELLMSPLNKQLAIFMTLYVLLGLFWFPLVLVLLSLITSGAGH